MEAFALGLGVTPFLAGRTFLVLGVLAAYYAIAGMLHGELGWKSALLGIVAGFLSLGLQLLAEKLRKWLEAIDEAVREWMDRANTAFVTLVAVLFAARSMGLLWSEATAPAAAPGEGTEVALAGFPPELIGLLAVGLFAWAFATLRARLRALFAYLPLSEMGGLPQWLFLLEAGFSFLGLLIAVLFPWVGAALAVLMLLCLVGIVLSVRHAAEGSRGPCESCEHELHLGATLCPECHESRAPSTLGLFGRTGKGSPTDLEAHSHRLLTLRRCPRCAEPIGGDLSVPCAACDEVPLQSEEATRAFLRYIDLRMAALTPVFIGLMLLPGIGLVFALLIYKLGPPGCLGGYLRWHQAFGTRLLRFLALVLLAFLQPVPLVGIAAGVGLLFAMHLWSRRSFLAAAPREATDTGALPEPA